MDLRTVGAHRRVPTVVPLDADFKSFASVYRSRRYRI
jgi:hypothetical protein